uniref:ribosomal RNA small subunit methyltransferase A n=1 Tax=uncultured Actinomyces sp. TaxID=249061 RepID=UPI00260EE1F9
ANLPYNVAVPLILGVLDNFPSVRELLVMVQTEVAQRLSAKPGSKIYGVPSVKVAWYGDAELAGTISRRVFWPIPNVDSSLVRISRYEADALPAAELAEITRQELFAVVDAAFAQRRKTLRAALKKWADVDVDALLENAGIDPSARGEVLDIDEFLALAKARNELKQSAS